MTMEAMKKQHSSKFFTFFLENLQLLCKSHLNFDQVVEVSGYVCLDLDNCKKERYFLSELIHSSGTVSSASCCTQVTTSKPGAADGGSEQRSDKLEEGQESNDSECIETEISQSAETGLKCNKVELASDNDPVSEGGCQERPVDTTEAYIQMPERKESAGEADFSVDEVDLSNIKDEAEETDDNLEVGFMSSNHFHHNSEEVKQLKERIQAISNAKMAVPWLGTPLIQSIRNMNSAERMEIQSPEKHFKPSPVSAVNIPSAAGSIALSNCYPVSIASSDMLQTSQANSAIQTSSGLNASAFFQNGIASSNSILNKSEMNLGLGLASLGNYNLQHVLNAPSRQSKKPKANATYRARQNWRYAVRQFENFLRFKGLEVVPIYTIPPVQLDGMLCEFIKWVKKNNGEDFHPWSVKNFFYHLEYHLKECGYASSITKGAEFKNSRDVLRQKVSDLETKLHEASQIF